ncbi:BrnT family toxin [Campylobacter upsaliensis]|nr:BrnT family toxin [Campylobacter upsaliensis]MCR2122810.1 BrnT family toxin [Campylobacter upsaliensis]
MGRRKNKTNQIKHGISFDVVREIFDDPLALSFLDER